MARLEPKLEGTKSVRRSEASLIPAVLIGDLADPDGTGASHGRSRAIRSSGRRFIVYFVWRINTEICEAASETLKDSTAHGYYAFGLIGTAFRELEWKTLIFFERAIPISANAWLTGAALNEYFLNPTEEAASSMQQTVAEVKEVFATQIIGERLKIRGIFSHGR
jgi:hypothetical protein